MTYADGRAIRAGTHDVSHHIGFYAAWTVVVLLARLVRLTRWALREGWYRPRLATAVAVSSLVGFWTTPLGFVITLATTMLGIATWEVINFGHSTRASAWAYGRSLKDLSRLVYRAWVVARRWRDLAAGFLKAEHGLTGDAPRLRQWRFHSRVRASCVVNVSNAKQHIVDDLAGKAPILAQTLKLHSAAVEPVRGRPGLARFTFYWGSRLEEVQPITELPEPQTGWGRMSRQRVSGWTCPLYSQASHVPGKAPQCGLLFSQRSNSTKRVVTRLSSGWLTSRSPSSLTLSR